MAMFITGNLNLFDNETAKELGFKNSEEYVKEFVQEWEAQATDEDHIWILGNLSVYDAPSALSVIEPLPGMKHLITGPRDLVCPSSRNGWAFEPRYREVFDHISTSSRRRIKGRDCLLSYHGVARPNDCWWSLKDRQDAVYLSASRNITDTSQSAWESPRELNVAWGTWGGLVSWDEVKSEFHTVV